MSLGSHTIFFIIVNLQMFCQFLLYSRETQLHLHIHSFFHSLITRNEIEYVIKTLPTNKSPDQMASHDILESSGAVLCDQGGRIRLCSRAHTCEYVLVGMPVCM